MGTGLSAGKTIYQKLSSDETLKGIVGDKIYPLVIQEGASFPFITFTLENLVPKNGHKFDKIDNIVFVVACVSDKYDEAVEAAEAVRSALNVADVKLESATEDYQEGAFVKILNFEIEWEH